VERRSRANADLGVTEILLQTRFFNRLNLAEVISQHPPVPAEPLEPLEEQSPWTLRTALTLRRRPPTGRSRTG
jgi:hypothetical protein